jgi:hypothetical protein
MSRVIRCSLDVSVCRILAVRRLNASRAAGRRLIEVHECSDTSVLQAPVNEEHLTGGEVYSTFIDHLELDRELKEPSDSIIARLDRAAISGGTQEAGVADAAPTTRKVFGNVVETCERIQVAA